jgi:hypothetical protein
MLAALICVILILPVTGADSLARGGRFTVTIAGKPNTAYYVWLARTFTMSGEPGDQPPVIVANIERVEFDPDGGPYVIGNYRFSNGNGRTILDDVAPSSGTTSNTRYYARVTTDIDGIAIVSFATSSATAQKTFPVRAENPASPGEDVPVKLGLPAPRTTVPATTMPVIMETPPELAAQSPAGTPVTDQPVTFSTMISPVVPVTTKKAPVCCTGVLAAIVLALFTLRSGKT